MQFETTIYGRVSIPIDPDSVTDLHSLKNRRPRLRVQVRRGSQHFLIPLQSIIMERITDIGYDIRRLAKLAFA